MKSFRQLCFALMLTLALAGTSLAGEMNAPPAPAPGEMNAPPRAVWGDTNSPPVAAPGEIALPGIAEEMQDSGLIAFLFSLVGFHS